MPDLGPNAAAETQFTVLGSAQRADDVELGYRYAYPDTGQRAWVRANFITSIDGGATTGDTSGGLAGPGDRSLFLLLRALADIIVVGAGTVRIENYGGAQPSAVQRHHRRARGQSEVPRLALVTNSGRLDPAMPVFTRTEMAPLVLTCTTSAEPTRHRLAGVAEVVDCSGDNPGRVDVTNALTAATADGGYRVLTEGGPALLGSLIDAGLLDELCLTVAPYVVGGHALRAATGPGSALTRMRCRHVLTDDTGYLYTRYTRCG